MSIVPWSKIFCFKMSKDGPRTIKSDEKQIETRILSQLELELNFFANMSVAAVLDHSFVTTNLLQTLDFRRGISNMVQIPGQADIRSFLNFIESPDS